MDAPTPLKRAAEDDTATDTISHAHKKVRSDHAAAAPTAAAASVSSPADADADESSSAASYVPDQSQLHPRSLYRIRGPPDFIALAAADEEFRPFVTVRQARGGADGAAVPTGATASFGTLDWKDPRALLALTSVLLRRDFGLAAFDMPLNHLVPPVTQRLNYMHWIAEISGTPEESTHQITDEKRSRHNMRGIDVGTGASCIFPLLGTSVYGFDWVATEVDPESVASARANVAANSLQDKIEVRPVSDPARILDGVVGDQERFDFMVCNPPFFSSLESTGLNRNRSAAATPGELVCPGGEEQFVASLIAQTKARPTLVRWSSSMIGRKASLKTLLALLHSKHIAAAVVQQCEFMQGTQARWGLAWTFDPEERRKQEEKLRRSETSTSAATTTADAAAHSFSSSAATDAHASLFVSPENVTARARFRINLRRSPLSGDQLLARLREATTQYAQHHGLNCTLSTPVNAGVIEFTIVMNPASAGHAASAASPNVVAWQCAVRLVAAPPSDWLVELEWKKAAAVASERAQAQMGFSLLATYLTRVCAGLH